MNKQLKWDLRFLDLAKYIAQWSKDPSTKTGAVITDQDNRIISTGYNGFPKNCDDVLDLYDNRPLKYQRIIHCEVNAILFAQRSLNNLTLYTYPFCSCSRCATLVIQSGIKRCVAPKLPNSLYERWEQDILLSKQMFKEANVDLIELDFQ